MSIATGKVKERLGSVRARIEAAALRSGRQASDITLVAVTKGAVAALISEACESALVTFGENKVQEAGEKIAQLNRPELQWHFIGHLQSNKVKSAVSLFHLIQSVDTVRLAEKINEEALAAGKIMPVLLEVNISGEEQKYGFSAEEIYTKLEPIAELPNLKVMGLMGMASEGDAEQARSQFKKLKGLFSVCRGMKKNAGTLEMKYLSMGMSDDFEIAIEEGSNMVRLGRAIFK